MSARLLSGVVLSVVAVACAPIAMAGPGCRPDGEAVTLPDELAESSGVALGVAHPDVLWTHNDGNSDLFAVDSAGVVAARFPIGQRLRDWEDIEVASCSVAAACLYFADVGDNLERRRPGSIRILRVPEPDPAAPRTLEPDVFPIRLPEGPRDVEALFVLPGERVYLVTKGRQDRITVYRYPPPLRPDTVTLEQVQRLTAGPAPLLDQVTGASASADGSIVAVRTYQILRFYRVQADTLSRMPKSLVNLRTLQEVQGEGVGLGSDGRLVLTSEGGPLGGPASMWFLRCQL